MAAVRSMIAGHRRIVIVALLALAAAAVGSAAYVRSGSSATPAGVEPAKPAGLHVPRAATWPLRVSRNRRYLIDGRQRPFLIVGDSPQALIGNLSQAQADSFFADRERAGFDAMWINLLCDQYTGCRSDGTTYDGIAPFTQPGNLATPNPSYFARAAAMIGLAAKHHLAVFLDPIETGGWLEVLRSNGTAKAYAYGRYLGRRFRRWQNIVWLNGNDFQTWSTRSDDALVLAVARGIRSTDPKALQTVELNYEVSTSSDDPRWRPIINLDAAYTYAPTYAEVLKAYRRDHVPVFMIEASYEGEHQYTGPETLRREEYWTLLSGATGQFYGNKYTWPFAPGWQSHLDTVGSRQLSFVTKLFVHRRWFDLIPDTRHRLVTSGYGTFSTGDDLNDNDYVTAARTGNGRLAIAYLPTGQPVTVDLRRMAGRRVRAQWYDPTTGRYSRVHGSPFRRTASRQFAVPGRNHDGDADWVLVLSAGRR
jgi:hypothetical protein